MVHEKIQPLYNLYEKYVYRTIDRYEKKGLAFYLGFSIHFFFIPLKVFNTNYTIINYYQYFFFFFAMGYTFDKSRPFDLHRVPVRHKLQYIIIRVYFLPSTFSFLPRHVFL